MVPGSTTYGRTSPDRAWRGTHRVPFSPRQDGDSFLQNTSRRIGVRNDQVNKMQFAHDATRQRKGIKIVQAHGAGELVEDRGEPRPGVEEAQELLAAGI